MAIIRFSIDGDTVRFGTGRPRQNVTSCGCNEPYKGRYWCPKKRWFAKEPCPFHCLRECDNYQTMCGFL